MAPNYSAPVLLDPSTCSSFQGRDQTVYFLISAILMYDLQKLLRGKPYTAHGARFITPTCLRVSVWDSRKHLTRDCEQPGASAEIWCLSYLFQEIMGLLSDDKVAGVPWLSYLVSADFAR